MKKIANKLKNYHLSKHSILICCLILMTIGYATVSSKLSTNGSALLAVNLSDLDCYIGNVFVDSKNHFDYSSCGGCCFCGGGGGQVSHLL